VQAAVAVVAVLGIASSVVIWVAVLRIYHDQQATDRHLCLTNRLIYAEQQKVRVVLHKPPLPPIPPCPPIP
jgi:hypothetical protein